MASTELYYDIGDVERRSDLEHIVGITGKLSDGRKKVADLFPDIELYVTLSTTGGDCASPVYVVEMGAESGDRLRLGLYAFFGAAGLPYFAEGSYADVDAALSKYGKKLKRTFAGALIGRRVVDSKS